MNAELLVVRADASTEMGTGHVMRCLALAQEWRRQGGSVVFATVCSIPKLEQRIRQEGVEVVAVSQAMGGREDALALAALASGRRAAWVVVDGYQFDPAYQGSVKASGARLLVIDDHGHAGTYQADLVLDQNLAANAGAYAKRRPDTELLMGTRYALLRQEFRQEAVHSAPVRAECRNVLVTMGGSDPENATGKVLEALAGCGIPRMEVRAVVGSGNPHLEALSEVAKHSASTRLEIDVTDMPGLMRWADLAITAAGSTVWELAAMGVPMLLLPMVEHQVPIAEAMAAEGAGVNLGWTADGVHDGLVHALTELVGATDRRQRLSDAGRRLVDGKGAERVVDAMKLAAK